MRSISKFVSILLFFVIQISFTEAKNVSIEDLENVAINLAQEINPSVKYSIRGENILAKEYNDNHEFMVINLHPYGWVAVSKDDRYTPIIGYSLESRSYVENEEKTLAYQTWVKGIDQDIKQAKIEKKSNIEISEQWDHYTHSPEDKILKTTRTISRVKTRTNIIGPLLKDIAWEQGLPYNNNIPKINGVHPVVGCVATAWAEIMAYHEWPQRGRGSHSYEHKILGTLSADFNTVYNWKNITDLDKAKISYYIGIAVDMNYTLAESGAQIKEESIEKYFNYSLESARSEHEYSDSEWNKKIINSLDNNRPIFYTGYPKYSSGCGNNNVCDSNLGPKGHAFVIDGYNLSRNEFHFSYGWGGNYDGWYKLRGQTYSQNQWAVFNIYRDSSPLLNAPTDIKVTNLTQDSATISWTDNLTNELGFRVYLNKLTKEAYGTKDVLVATVGKNVTSVNLSGLSIGTQYKLIVESYNQTRVKRTTRTLFTLYPPKSDITYPTNNAFIGYSENNVTFRWQNHGAEREYLLVQQRTSNGYITLFDDNVSGDSKMLTLPRNSLIYVSLRSFEGKKNWLGTSNIHFNIGAAPGKPGSPQNFTVTNITSTSAKLSWTYDVSQIRDGFKIYRDGTLVKTVTTSVKSYILTDLTANTNYTYSVKAYYTTSGSSNGGIRETIYSDAATKAFKTINDNYIVSKSIFTSPVSGVEVDANETLALSWINHGATRVDVYIGAKVNNKYIKIKSVDNIVEESLNFKLPSGFASAYANLMSYDANGKLLGRETIYMNSRKENPKPVGPSYLSATNVKQTTATLIWKDNSENEEGFKIYKGPYEDLQLIKTVGANVKSYKLTGLTANTIYRYRVKAYNSAGISGYTSTAFKTQVSENNATQKFIDTDNDGISDSDEKRLGFDPLNAKDGLADYDGDGFSNAKEFKVGTDMKDSNDKPQWVPLYITDLMTFLPMKMNKLK